MFQVMATNRELLRSQRELPVDARQHMLLLRFAEPIPEWGCGEFLRIQLTPGMLNSGEPTAYKPHISQPHRMAMERCPLCNSQMHRLDLNHWQCRQSGCRLPDDRPSSQVRFVGGPLQGVVKLVHAPDFVARTETKTLSFGLTTTTRYVNAVILLLDRRYRDETLEAVVRTAGIICDQMGWKLVTT